jgi:protein required for attachment to host cells
MLPSFAMNAKPDHVCVLVADGARARLLSLELGAAGDSQGRGKPRLFERADWIHPEHRMKEHELFPEKHTDAATQVGGRHYTLEDHRHAHERELDRRFASELAEEIGRFVRHTPTSRLVIVADPRMLGVLRGELSHIEQSGVHLTALAKDLTRSTSTAIQEHLEREGMLGNDAVHA